MLEHLMDHPLGLDRLTLFSSHSVDIIRIGILLRNTIVLDPQGSPTPHRRTSELRSGPAIRSDDLRVAAAGNNIAPS